MRLLPVHAMMAIMITEEAQHVFLVATLVSLARTTPCASLAILLIAES